jgi:hypothetical protein
VEISNADPIAVLMAPAATSLEKYRAVQIAFGSAFSNNEFTELFTATESIQITGVVLQVNAGGASGSCTYRLAIVNANDAFIAPLASVEVFAGRSLSSPVIPFSNLTLPAGYKVARTSSNDTGAVCAGNLNLYMSKS